MYRCGSLDVPHPTGWRRDQPGEGHQSGKTDNTAEGNEASRPNSLGVVSCKTLPLAFLGWP